MKTPTDCAPRSENLEATLILDHGDPEIQRLAAALRQPDQTDRMLLQRVHSELLRTLCPVYSVNEWQPASKTLQNARGSCSQRMACLEAVARAAGIPTRVRVLAVSGTFWYPRFRFSRYLIPRRILLTWPQFFLEGDWVDFDELHAPIAQLAAATPHGFTNDGESLFEAVRNTPIDFLGKTCGLACAKPGQDLSKFILQNHGFFDTRDEVFERFGSFQETIRGRIFEIVFGNQKSF